MKKRRLESFFGYCLAILFQVLFIFALEWCKMMERLHRKLPPKSAIINLLERRSI